MEHADTRRCLFVFYTVSLKGEPFDLDDDLPTGWEWIGSGMTYPIYNTKTQKGRLDQMYRNQFGPPTKYKNESQYMGPPETYEDMKHYLYKNFNRLKDTGIIQFYHIQDTFSPVPV